MVQKGKYDKDHALAIKARERVPRIIDSVSPDELITAIKNAPSLRGMILGYIAEVKFESEVLLPHALTDDIRSFDDHNRAENKADRAFVYRGKRITVQLKSIQTNSIKWSFEHESLLADVQNDGSDRRPVLLPNGNTVVTTNYRIGDYDVLAVPLFPFTGNWDFAYKLNRDCRLTSSTKYALDDAKYLLSTVEKITYPLLEDWTMDLDEISLRV